MLRKQLKSFKNLKNVEMKIYDNLKTVVANVENDHSRRDQENKFRIDKVESDLVSLIEENKKLLENDEYEIL